MSTRCVIVVMSNGSIYKIYRNYDGYPQAVLEDLKKLYDNGIKPVDGEYFLANFIFLAKYNFLVSGLAWELGYGVCSLDCKHGDLDYKYIIYDHGNAIKIEKYDFDRDGFFTVYNGDIYRAFEKYRVKGEGFHIKFIP